MPFWRKLAIQIFVILAIITLLGVAGWKGWKAWHIRTLLTQSRTHLEKNDLKSALLTARRAIDYDPSSEAASRIMADAAERAGLPDSVGWRRRVHELSPGPNEAMAWARTAVKFAEWASARNALNAVPETQRANAAYQQLAAGVAVGSGLLREAGPFYAEAVRLDPGNPMHRFNHARWLLDFAADPTQREAAAATLRALTESPTHGIHARRALRSRAMQQGQWKDALTDSAPIFQHAEANEHDRIMHLDVLHALKDPALPEALSATQRAATTTPAIVATLEWMRSHERAADAITWSKPLPDALRQDPAVATAIAACFDTAKDWPALRDHTQAGNWAGNEYLRFAYLARAQRQLGDIAGSSSNWDAAATAASRFPTAIEQLILRTTEWGWRFESRQLLWSAAEGPRAAWALAALYRTYRDEQDVSGMLRTSRRLLEHEPTNDAARNNVAALSLLLSEDIPQATEIAADLYKRQPGKVGIASTHAFALWKNQRAAEGLAILEKFKPEELRHPSIAGYYGLLLAAAGRPQAREHLQIALHAPLLSLEKTLFSEALRTAPAL